MSKINKQMVSLVNPRPTDKLAAMCHKRNTLAPQVRSGGLQQVAPRSPHEAIRAHAVLQKSCCLWGDHHGLQEISFIQGLKRLLQARVGRQDKGHPQAAREGVGQMGWLVLATARGDAHANRRRL